MKKLLTCVAIAGASSLQASDLPSQSKDYYSLQIASGTDARALEKLFDRYADLPYVRVEQRGALYVLRAGFWDDKTAARQAVAGSSADEAFLRVAVFRPEAIIQKNWTEGARETVPSELSSSAPLASLPSAPAQMPGLPAPTPPVTPTPSAVKLTDEALALRELRPFNQEDFVLAYDVLLGSGGLERAFLVAQKAVQQSPRDELWRRKLAQVAEWTGRPTLAAEQWQAIFQQGDHSSDTVTQVLRMGPLLASPLVAIEAWSIRDRQAPLTEAQWRDVYELFESASEPALGSQFFEARFEKTQTPVFLEYAAWLAENGGDDARAEGLFLRRMKLEPFSMDVLLRATVSLIRRDRLADALSLMRTHDHQVAPQDAEFWRLLGQVAFDQRDFSTAQTAYRQASQTQASTVDDWSRLVFMVRQKHPAQAAALAVEAYRRLGSVEQLLAGMEIYAAIGDVKSQAGVIRTLKSADLAMLEQSVRFLLLRARIYQQQKQTDLALADLSRALQLQPGSSEVAIPLLWFLIDEQRVGDLASALKRYAAQADKNPDYWQPYAAALQALDRHSEAVKWYGREVRRDPENPLTLLNYADALERTQQVGMASRIRRHAWMLLKNKEPVALGLLNPGLTPNTVALGRLALMDQPGDPGMNIVRQWLVQARGAGSEQMDEQTRVLVLGWAIVKEQFVNAQSWMWRRYAEQNGVNAPLWGQSQVALQLNDTDTIARLLDQNSDGLPIYNRYDTAYALGDVQQALDISFKGMTNEGNDEPLYDRFRQHVPLHANYVQVAWGDERPGSIHREGFQSEVRLVPHPKLHFVVSMAKMAQSSSSADLRDLVPKSDPIGSVEVKWFGLRGESSLTLFRRNELEGYNGLRLTQSYQWDRRISLDGALEYGGNSTLSEPMRVAGYENSLSAGLTYALGKREYIRVAPRFAHYYTQFGNYLGKGRSLDVEAGYRIRTEYPDWRLRAVASVQRTTVDGSIRQREILKLPANLQSSFSSGALDPVGFFVPPAASSLGACLSMGENLQGQNIQTTYSRAWRPFFDLCLRHTEGTGFGYSGVMGLAGSVTGEDHLLLQLQNNKDMNNGGDASPSFTIRYRHYF